MSFILTCKEVHRLTSEGMDRALSPIERARIRMHLLICGPCTRFSGQMQLIRRAMRQLTPPAGLDTDGDLK